MSSPARALMTAAGSLMDVTAIAAGQTGLRDVTGVTATTGDSLPTFSFYSFCFGFIFIHVALCHRYSSGPCL